LYFSIIFFLIDDLITFGTGTGELHVERALKLIPLKKGCDFKVSKSFQLPGCPQPNLFHGSFSRSLLQRSFATSGKFSGNSTGSSSIFCNVSSSKAPLNGECSAKNL